MFYANYPFLKIVESKRNAWVVFGGEFRMTFMADKKYAKSLIFN